MVSKRKGHIALISVHGDPAAEIGKDAAGGQNVYVRQVGESLAEQGWTVDMFTRRDHPLQAKVVEHRPRCRTIRLDAGPHVFIDRNKLYDYVPEFVEAFLRFQHQTGVIYHLIHTNYWLSGAVGLAIQNKQITKLVHTYHSLGAVKYQAAKTLPMIAKRRLKVETQCLESMDRIVATSPQEEEHMRAFLSSEGDIDIVPCGTDIERFGSVNYGHARQVLGFTPEQKVVLYAGRFDPRKGIETLVRAVSPLTAEYGESLRLVLVGGSHAGQKDGDERDRIESIVRELGIAESVTFTGRLDHDKLSEYYAAADVCVVPSHYEPFGLVAIEAMACGTPVIASNVGGLKFSVNHQETGLLVPAQDEQAFTAAIQQILADPDLRHRMGTAGRCRVEQLFSWNGVAEQLDCLYQNLQVELYQEFFQPAS